MNVAESDTDVLVRNLRTEAADIKQELRTLNASVKVFVDIVESKRAFREMVQRIAAYGALAVVGVLVAILIWNVVTDIFWSMVGGRP